MTTSGPAGVVVSVNVAQPRARRWRGRTVTTAIGKQPVTGPVDVGPEGIHGDAQADRRVHGGPDKAVYAYAAEDAVWWAGHLGRDLAPGAFGENLTVAAVEVTGALIGELWAVGTCLLQVVQPRMPCTKLALAFDDPQMPRRFLAAGRPGAYLRVLVPGSLRAGDAVEVVDRPDHGVTVGMVAAERANA